MDRGKALRVHGDALGGLHRWRNLESELGFWHCRESEGQRREKGAVLGFPWWRRASYSRPGSAAFISSVGKAAVDRVPREAPSSCLCPEVEDGEGVSWAGCWWAEQLGCDGWAVARCSLSYYYFCYVSFLFSISVFISNFFLTLICRNFNLRFLLDIFRCSVVSHNVLRYILFVIAPKIL
jgi:hypothetical protein